MTYREDNGIHIAQLEELKLSNMLSQRPHGATEMVVIQQAVPSEDTNLPEDLQSVVSEGYAPVDGEDGYCVPSISSRQIQEQFSGSNITAWKEFLAEHDGPPKKLDDLPPYLVQLHNAVIDCRQVAEDYFDGFVPLSDGIWEVEVRKEMARHFNDLDSVTTSLFDIYTNEIIVPDTERDAINKDFKVHVDEFAERKQGLDAFKDKHKGTREEQLALTRNTNTYWRQDGYDFVKSLNKFLRRQERQLSFKLVEGQKKWQSHVVAARVGGTSDRERLQLALASLDDIAKLCKAKSLEESLNSAVHLFLHCNGGKLEKVLQGLTAFEETENLSCPSADSLLNGTGPEPILPITKDVLSDWINALPAAKSWCGEGSSCPRDMATFIGCLHSDQNLLEESKYWFTKVNQVFRIKAPPAATRYHMELQLGLLHLKSRSLSQSTDLETARTHFITALEGFQDEDDKVKQSSQTKDSPNEHNYAKMIAWHHLACICKKTGQPKQAEQYQKQARSAMRHFWSEQEINGQVNGQAVNGQQVNGQQVNGQQVNGQAVNGKAVNGKEVSQQEFNALSIYG